jgi:hypothetical protein
MAVVARRQVVTRSSRPSPLAPNRSDANKIVVRVRVSEALTKRLLRTALLESVHVSAHLIYTMLAQEALDPFVER